MVSSRSRRSADGDISYRPIPYRPITNGISAVCPSTVMRSVYRPGSNGALSARDRVFPSCVWLNPPLTGVNDCSPRRQLLTGRRNDPRRRALHDARLELDGIGNLRHASLEHRRTRQRPHDGAHLLAGAAVSLSLAERHAFDAGGQCHARLLWRRCHCERNQNRHR